MWLGWWCAIISWWAKDDLQLLLLLPSPLKHWDYRCELPHLVYASLMTEPQGFPKSRESVLSSSYL